MSRYYVPLPQPNAGNAMIDFSPVNQGLNAIGQARQQQTENALAREKMDMAREQHDWTRQRAAKQDARSDVEWYGKQAAVPRPRGAEPCASCAMVFDVIRSPPTRG